VAAVVEFPEEGCRHDVAFDIAAAGRRLIRPQRDAGRRARKAQGVRLCRNDAGNYVNSAHFLTLGSSPAESCSAWLTVSPGSGLWPEPPFFLKIRI